MTMTRIKRLLDKYRPLFLGLLLFCFHGNVRAQTYNPSTCCTVSNKSFGPAQAVSSDGRSWFYDATNFVMRDYNGPTEVYSYLNLTKYRQGHFPIYVHTGGLLQSNGVWVGGSTLIYWFKDSTGNANLVRWYTDSNGIAGGPFYAVANNLSEGNAGLIKGNLALDNVNNTSDAAKNAASVSLTNHTIDGNTNTLVNIPNSALTNNSTGISVTSNAGSDISVTTTPAALGSSLVVNIPSGGISSRGAITSADWNTFKGKQDPITLTVAGSSGPATLVGPVLNIPQYSAGSACLNCNADSLKHLPVDTSSHRNGYILAFDSTNHKWYLTPNAGSGSGITQLTGDVTAGPGSGSQATTLATVNSNVGTFGSASTVYQGAVNGKGLTTAASSVAIQIAESQVTNLTTDLAGKLPTTLTSGDIFVGNGSNVATGVAVTGDIGLNNAGLSTIQPNVVSYSKMQTIPNLSYPGNVSGSTGNMSSLNYVYFNVKDFGAVGDSATDDRAAIIAAITAMPASGGVLWFPAGKYRVSDSILLTKSIRLEGVNESLGSQFLGNREGGSYIYGGANNKNVFVVDSTTTGRPVVGFQYLTIASCLAGGTPTGGAGILIRGFAQRPFIDHCTISGFFRDIDIVSAFYWTVSNSWIGNPVSSALRCNDTQRTDTGDWGVFNCDFISGNFNGIAKGVEWGSGGGVRISDCKFDAQSFTVSTQFTYAIWIANNLAATSDIQIDHVSIEDYQLSGILDSCINRIAHHLFTNIQIAGVGSTKPAIDVYSATGFVMTNYVLTDWSLNSGTAMRFTNCKGVDVSDGYVYGFASPYTTAGSTVLNKMHYNYSPLNPDNTTAYKENMVLTTDEAASGYNLDLVNLNAGAFAQTSVNFYDNTGVGHSVKGSSLFHYGTGSSQPFTQSFGIWNYDKGFIHFATNNSIKFSIDTIGRIFIDSAGLHSFQNPTDLNIYHAKAGAIGANFQNITNNGREELTFQETVANYSGIGRFNTASAGNWLNTSIPVANSSYVYTIFNNVTGSKPFIVNAPLITIPGVGSTNLGFRQDSIGMRVDQIQNLHTVNTVSLQVAGIVYHPLDSTTYKLTAIDANGKFIKTDWPTFGSASTNIYNTDGTLTANRTLSSGGFSLTFGSNATKLSAFNLYSNNISLTAPGSGYITLNGPYNELAQTTASDANFSSSGDNIIILPVITANRTVTLPSASTTGVIGRPIVILNENSAAFTWTYASTVLDVSGNTITAIPKGAVQKIQSDGTNWRLLQSYNSTGNPIQYQHTIFTPTTGATVSLVNNQYNIINPAGALLAVTLNLPSSPVNNDVVYIKFTQTVSTVTYANGTVVDGITAPSAGGLVVLTYDSGTTSWY